MSKKLIVIAGPTAVGKTDLSIELAAYFSTEIISADSRQFYKEMNIGTAKPSPSQLVDTKHHFINSLSIVDDYNAGKFERECIALLDILFESHDCVIMTGGSGLYINAVINGVDDLPKADTALREKLNKSFKESGIAILQTQLLQLDPEYYEKVDKQNPHRLIRAIEVCLLSGKKYSELLNKKKPKRNFETVFAGLFLEKEILYDRINLRVDKMLADGLEHEVASVLAFKNCNALQTVGYKEMIAYFEGHHSLYDAVELIKKNTRNYAKRQMTWFKKVKEIEWFDMSDQQNVLRQVIVKIKS